MSSRRVHHGLITVERGFGRPGIFWLRLWRNGPGHVAVVTEVPGNPGLSVTNATSLIRALLITAHGVAPDALLLFEIWPAGSVGADESTRYLRVDFDPSLEWTEVERSELETAAGETLPPLPAHDDLYAMVRSTGGGNFQEIYRRVFEAVAVNDIPVPHCPGSCRHFSRFERIQAELEDPALSREELEHEVGQRFLASLSWWDRLRCRFHRGRWRAIANESVRIIEELGPADSELYAEEAVRARLRDRDRTWLESLFSDPIDIAGGGFTNGQHRACALRFSGAKRATLVVADEYVGEVEHLWIYQGGG